MSANQQSAIKNPRSKSAQRSFVPRSSSRMLLPLMVVAAMALSFVGVQRPAAAPEIRESNRVRFDGLFARPLSVGPMVPAAMTFVVNTTNDTLLAGACAAATAGQCSLREAITEANANSGADTIDATGITGTINLTGVLPDITEGVTVNGPGAGLLTVRRDTGGDYRIFNVTTSGTVTFSGLIISNGNAVGSASGGGIANNAGGTVNLTNSILSNNSTGSSSSSSGGGIANNFGGTVNVTNSTLSGNLVLGGIFTLGGGGIANNAGGTVNVINSTLSSNSAVGSSLHGGGGIANNAGGTVKVTDSTLSNNSAPDSEGGAIHNNSTGTVTVTNSTLNGNTATFGAGGIFNSGTLDISNSTLSSNSNSAGAGGGGGGIWNFGGNLSVTNSTVSGNSCDFGGGISNTNSGTVNLKSTIVALNAALTSGPDLDGAINSQGYNVVGTTSGATIVATTGDQFGVTAAQLKLDPLGNNGGPTQTMALESGSVAIDHGINSSSLTTDQRSVGFARTFDDPLVTNATGGDGTDVGAFEAQPPDQPPVAKCKNIQVSAGSSCTASIVPANIDNGSFDPDSGDTITLTLDHSGPFGLGAHTVTLTATDSHGLFSSCTATVTVVDNTNPTITGVSADPSSIWPPNKKMVLVTVNYTASDSCSPSPVSVLSVSSNEGTSADWEIVDAHHVRLRADRNGNGNGRIYTITITSTDTSGNSTTRTVLVTVPHDQGH